MENYIMTLIERQQRSLHYHQTDKYKYLTGEEMLPPQQHRVIQ